MSLIAKKILSDRSKTFLLQLKALFLSRIEKVYCLSFRILGQKITLQYNSQQKTDGTGAQLQRLLAIYALTIRYRFKYIHEPINSVAVHPLDPFQTPAELKAYIDQLNYLFDFPSHVHNSGKLHYVDVAVLRLNHLFVLAVKSKLTNRNTVIRVVEPYGVIECCPEAYMVLISKLNNWNKYAMLKRNNTDTKIKKIVIHYRSGVGGMAVQKGEKFPREIKLEYFELLIEEIVINVECDYQIFIFTDAPPNDLTFHPPSDQTELWSNSPRFQEGEMRVQGNNLANSLQYLGSKCVVEIGGSPIDALAAMSSADFLLMGRSSLSFVAALLNETGEIYFPPRFWHKPLPKWKKPRKDLRYY